MLLAAGIREGFMEEVTFELDSERRVGFELDSGVLPPLALVPRTSCCSYVSPAEGRLSNDGLESPFSQVSQGGLSTP